MAKKQHIRNVSNSLAQRAISADDGKRYKETIDSKIQSDGRTITDLSNAEYQQYIFEATKQLHIENLKLHRTITPRKARQNYILANKVIKATGFIKELEQLLISGYRYSDDIAEVDVELSKRELSNLFSENDKIRSLAIETRREGAENGIGPRSVKNSATTNESSAGSSFDWIGFLTALFFGEAWKVGWTFIVVIFIIVYVVVGPKAVPKYKESFGECFTKYVQEYGWSESNALTQCQKMGR